MHHLKSMLILGLLAVTLSTCCCPCSSCASLLGGKGEFTTGDFADAPPYPGSTQTTESDPVLGMVPATISIIAEEAEWKHYITTDSDADVLEWYEEELPAHGWNSTSAEGGLTFEKEGDPNELLFIFAAPDSGGSDETHILIGRLSLEATE